MSKERSIEEEASRQFAIELELQRLRADHQLELDRQSRELTARIAAASVWPKVEAVDPDEDQLDADDLDGDAHDALVAQREAARAEVVTAE